MAGNDWINSYLEAILDVGPALDDVKSSLLLRERGQFSPTRYFVEEVITGFDETDIHRSWVKAAAKRSPRNSRLENMCWRIWHLARQKKQAILDVEPSLDNHFSPTRYLVEEVTTGFDETDIHRSWVKAAAKRSPRNTKLENMCWRISNLARQKKQLGVSFLGSITHQGVSGGEDNTTRINTLLPLQQRRDDFAPPQDKHEEPICRICLQNISEEGGVLFELRCSCKGDLSKAHKECLLKWFALQETRLCDVCKHEVKNLPVWIKHKTYPTTDFEHELQNLNATALLSGFSLAPSINHVLNYYSGLLAGEDEDEVEDEDSLDGDELMMENLVYESDDDNTQSSINYDEEDNFMLSHEWDFEQRKSHGRRRQAARRRDKTKTRKEDESFLY